MAISYTNLMSESLRYGINSLYKAFANVRKPRTIEACPCCLGEEDIATLLQKPLRELTPEELSGYASSVFLTVGAAADFVYFLPRILEIRATASSWSPDPEVVGRAIHAYGWENFSPAQQESLASYIGAKLTEQIGMPRYSNLDAWLCFASYFWPQWSSYLKLIKQEPTALISLYEWHNTALQRGKLGNGFWDESPGQELLIEWFSLPSVQNEIFASYELKSP